MDDGLRQVLMPLVILGTIGASLVLFTRTIADYILKKNTDENKYSTLKWGLIILFAGLSLILMEYIHYDSRSPLPYGLFAVFVSLGFLIYYFIVKKEFNR